MRSSVSSHPGHLGRVLLITIAGLLAASLASAQDVERTMRVFDCEFLVARKPDLPGPDLLPFPASSERQFVLEEEAEEFAGIFEPDRLVDMIRANVHPDSWHHEKNTIRFAQGKLIVVQTAEVHDGIASLLKEMRRSRSRMIHVVGRVLSVRSDHFATWHAAAARGGGAGAILTPDAVGHLLDVKPGDVRLRVLATVSMPASR